MNFKDWYELDQFFISESVTVSIEDKPQDSDAQNLSWLSHMVKNKLYKTIPAIHKGTNPELFTIDGLDVDSRDGIMNFYPAGIAEEAIPKILHAIKYYLGEFNATFDEFKEDMSGMFTGQKVYRIHVKLTKPAAPRTEINMSNTVASIIFQRILNFPENATRINARDLLIKLGNVADFTVQQHTSEPSTSQKPGHAKWIDSGIDEERLQRHLSGLARLAKIAIDNNYDYLELS